MCQQLRYGEIESEDRFYGFDENLDEGSGILDDSSIGNIENRRFRTRADGDNKTAPPHAGYMLDGHGYAAQNGRPHEQFALFKDCRFVRYARTRHSIFRI